MRLVLTRVYAVTCMIIVGTPTYIFKVGCAMYTGQQVALILSGTRAENIVRFYIVGQWRS